VDAYLTGQTVRVELADGSIELYVLSEGRVHGYELLGMVTTCSLDDAASAAADNVPDFRNRAVCFAHRIADPEQRTQYLESWSPEELEWLRTSGAQVLTFGFFAPDGDTQHPRLFSIERPTDESQHDDGDVVSRMPVIAHLPHTAIRMPLRERDALLLHGERQAEEIRDSGDPLLPHLFTWLPSAGCVSFTNTASPLLVDPIRQVEYDEPMATVGQGVVHTRAKNGDLLRSIDAVTRETMLRQYYAPYTEAFTQQVDSMLREFDACLVLNVLSFSAEPAACDLDRSADRPDVCIGADDLHTPQPLIDELTEQLGSVGLRVEVNRPVSGAYVPPRHRRRDRRVSSITIALRRDLYTDPRTGEESPDFLEFEGRITKAIAKGLEPWLASKAAYRKQSFNAQFTRLMSELLGPSEPTLLVSQEFTDALRTQFEHSGLEIHPKAMLRAAEALAVSILMGRDLERIGLLPPVDERDARFQLVGTVQRISDERSAFIQRLEAVDGDPEEPVGGPGWTWTIAEGAHEVVVGHAPTLPHALIDHMMPTFLAVWGERMRGDEEHQGVLERLRQSVRETSNSATRSR